MSKEWIMIVEGRNVYVGDALFFTPDFGDGQSYKREIHPQHKFLAQQKPEWVKQWSWKIKSKNKDE
jgi:hypothetical protein